MLFGSVKGNIAILLLYSNALLSGKDIVIMGIMPKMTEERFLRLYYYFTYTVLVSATRAGHARALRNGGDSPFLQRSGVKIIFPGNCL